jgi:hypothetical protein
MYQVSKWVEISLNNALKNEKINKCFRSKSTGPGRFGWLICSDRARTMVLIELA